MITVDLFATSMKLPPAVDMAKRIAQVGGFFNSLLRCDLKNSNALEGIVRGMNGSQRIQIDWKPDYRKFEIVNPPMKVTVKMDGLPVNLESVIRFSDINNPDQWKKFAETLGNIILDNVVHGNQGPTENELASGMEDDDDIDAKSVSIAASRLPQAGRLDGGTE